MGFQAEALMLLCRSLASHGYVSTTVIFKLVWNGANITRRRNSSVVLGTIAAQASARGNGGIEKIPVGHVTSVSISTCPRLRDVASEQLSISPDRSGFTLLLKDCQ